MNETRLEAAARDAGPIFVVAPRYARDLGLALEAQGIAATVVQRPATAAAALLNSPAVVAVVDARGAMAAAMLVAHEIAEILDERHGAMLVLVARGDAGGVAAARAAGATQVLAGPFGAAELGEAIGFAQRIVDRLAAAADGTPASRDRRLHRDPLTGLATAHHALGWLRGLLGGEGDPAAALLLIGVGRFAAINAAHGQPAANALLEAVAERLTRVVGEGSELVARMAGAEFAVLIPAPVTLGEATALAGRIVAAFEAPFAHERIVHLAVRVGIALPEPGGGDGAAERLFRQAGAALVTARSGPPGTIEVFRSGAVEDPLAHRADLESDLRVAVANDAFELVYQPQVALGADGGQVVGVEALVRWSHPEFGPLSAETLLEVAESAEFATEFGAAIRAKALREAAAWPATLDRLQLSVNVTAGDLRAPDFAETLGQAIAASGFPARRLVLEITESDLIENLDAASATLGELRTQGIRIALDDFGTGYSSLAYLKALPLDAIKLDKRLTRDLGARPRDRVVVRLVVALARALHIRVVAEGVETHEDLMLVAAARCDWYQGYLCSAGLPADELPGFVAAWRGACGHTGRSER